MNISIGIILLIILFSVVGFCATYLIGLTKKANKQQKELLRLMDELDTSFMCYKLLKGHPQGGSAREDVLSDWNRLDIFLLTFWNQEEANILRGEIRKVLYEEGDIATNLHME